MGLFGRTSENDRIRELEEGFSKLQREHNAIRLDWENFLDRALRMLQRITKRAETIEKLTAKDNPDGDEVNGREAVGLNPPIDPISARIIARRRRIISGGGGA